MAGQGALLAMLRGHWSYLQRPLCAGNLANLGNPGLRGQAASALSTWISSRASASQCLV